MAPAIKTVTLDRHIEDCRQSLAGAADRQDWQAVLEATLDGLLWRSVRLAIRLNIAPISFRPDISWKVTALQLRHICDRALADGDDSDDEADYRVEVVADVLNGLMDVAAALEAGQYKSANVAIQLTISAANLGRCELMLGFAEEGFWQQVYEWRRRQGGKPKGKGLAAWKKEAVPEVIRWIEEALKANGKVKIADLEKKLQDWLDDRKESRGREAVKSAIRQMREAELIPLPLNSKKVRKLSRP